MSFLHDLYGARGKAIADQGRVTIIGDKAGYVSPLDRTVVEGRTAHREHMKRHGVMEAGDMPMRTSSPDRAPMGSVRTDIQRSIQELRSR